jgi:cystathionine beta-lyase
MSMALRTLTGPGERVMAFTPVYRPFLDMVRLGGRTLVESPLVLEGRRWTVDFDRTEEILEVARQEGNPVRVLLFCSPHNPVGRVWSLSELQDLSRLAEEFDLTVFSDEIHQDLVLPPHRHRVLSMVTHQLSLRTVVFSGLGKTFNLAGLPLAHMIAFNPSLRSALKTALDGEFFHHPNILSQTAAKAALLGGSGWLNSLLGQVEENYQTLCRQLPVGMVEGLPAPLEGTYLAWVDFSPLIRKKNLSGDEELAGALEAKAGIRLSPGSWFGGPPGFLRINLACPPSQLQSGLERLVSFR